jgi:hypothetical protein
MQTVRTLSDSEYIEWAPVALAAIRRALNDHKLDQIISNAQRNS